MGSARLRHIRNCEIGDGLGKIAKSGPQQKKTAAPGGKGRSSGRKLRFSASAGVAESELVDIAPIEADIAELRVGQ